MLIYSCFYHPPRIEELLSNTSVELLYPNPTLYTSIV